MQIFEACGPSNTTTTCTQVTFSENDPPLKVFLIRNEGGIRFVYIIKRRSLNDRKSHTHSPPFHTWPRRNTPCRYPQDTSARHCAGMPWRSPCHHARPICASRRAI